MRTLPWKTREEDVILTSRLASSEARTPVVTRSDRPCLSICSVNFFTFSICAVLVAGTSSSSSSSIGGVSSPATEEAWEPFVEAFFELALEDNFETAVFLGFSACLAMRAALEAETGMLREGYLAVRDRDGTVSADTLDLSVLKALPEKN